MKQDHVFHAYCLMSLVSIPGDIIPSIYGRLSLHWEVNGVLHAYSWKDGEGALAKLGDGLLIVVNTCNRQYRGKRVDYCRLYDSLHLGFVFQELTERVNGMLDSK